MNNKKPDASHQLPPHRAQQDVEGKQAAQNPEELPNEASLILFPATDLHLGLHKGQEKPCTFSSERSTTVKSPR